MSGAPADGERAARAREDQRRVAAVTARWVDDFTLVGSRLAAAEAAPSPLPEDECRGVKEADERLQLLERGLEAWFAHSPAIAPVGEGYESADETLARAIRAPFLAQVHAGLATDTDAGLRALRLRVERATRRARDAEEARALAEEEAEKKRAADRERARPALMREEAEKDCRAACFSRVARCYSQCGSLTPSSCNMCNVDREACITGCKRVGDGGR